MPSSPLPILELFPRSYVASRARFRSEGGDHESFPVSSPTDPDLTVDTIYHGGGTARKLLVLQSGNHGVEGYAGSAIQGLFTSEFLDVFRGRGVDVLLVHALNPYGFKYHRRSDERNVNLNRNFTLDASLYRTENAGYDALRARLEPAKPLAAPVWERIKVGARLLASLPTIGRSKITAGLSGGQYRHARGLNYGGDAPSPQVDILYRVLDRRFEGHDSILFMDVHTGLGARGHLYLMPSPNASAPLWGALAPGLGALGPRIEVTDVEAETGFYSTTGDVPSFAVAKAGGDRRAVGLTMEFGTLGKGLFSQLESVIRLVQENQSRNYGTANAKVRARVESEFLALFNPTDESWRDSVVRQAQEVFGCLARSF